MRTLLLITFFFSAQAFGFADMSNTLARANDLNMTHNDYTFAMAIAGTISGSIFGLFVWKAK